MSVARFRVVRAGPHVSVQDAGRRGMKRFGVGASGPMDPLALEVANLALGNPAGAAAVEVSLGGLVLDCLEGEVALAVAGGGFSVSVDDAAQPSWSRFTVSAGQRLRIGPGPWGNWLILGFAGRLVAREWLGSVATHGPSGLGGGRLLPEQELVVEAPRARPFLDLPCPVFARAKREMRVVLGPQERFFDAGTLEQFLRGGFMLSSAYDRMGVRLHGPKLVPASRLDMPSEPLARGSVQVSGDGVPTVLLADHQTTGGYPKIATILGDDLDRFVQLRSHQPVAFRPVGPQEAVGVARSLAPRRRRYLEGIRRIAG